MKRRVNITDLACLISIFIFFQGVQESKSQGCTPWSDWTECDDTCKKERHRKDCDVNVEFSNCTSCTVSSTTTPPPSQCGEWQDWTDCDSACFRERHKQRCGYVIETEKCLNCTISSANACGDWSFWECDNSTCQETRTRRCPDEFEQQKQKCADCDLPIAATTAEKGGAEEAATGGKSTKKEGGGGNTIAIAGGIAGLVLIIAGAGGGGYFYVNRKQPQQDQDFERTLDVDQEDIAVNLRDAEEKADIMIEDWGNLND